MTTPKWGIVSTIKAPLDEIERFAAHHLDIGAHRLFLYLDDATAAEADYLNRHPKLRVTLTDAAHWAKRGPRPAKHQARQTANANHAYGRARDVDWLAHIDVDELLWPRVPLAQTLADLPPQTLCARARPQEALMPDENSAEKSAPGITHFKSFALPRAARDSETAAIYPTYGRLLNAGFLSHVAGKMIYRTGANITVKIHNVFQDEVMNPGEVELTTCPLLHLHAKDWPSFRAAFAYRHAMGSYRADLKPNRAPDQGGLSLHDLFAQIMAQGGEPALQAFYQEVCTASPDLMARLAHYGHLHGYPLDLESKRARHFPR